MDTLVTVLFLLLWIVVAFFLLRYAGQRYFHEPRRADVAALAVAVAFAAGALWPFSARIGAGPAPAPRPSVPVETSVVSAVVIGAGTPAGTRDTSAACRTLNRWVRTPSPGSMDDIRSDEQQSTTVPNGAQLNARVQYVVDGWASDHAVERPAEGVCLIVDGKLEPRARSFMGSSRPDLAAGYHHPELTPAGYVVIIPQGVLSPGKHHLQMIAKTPGGYSILPAARDVAVR